MCDWVIKGLGMSSRVCDWVIKGLGMSSRVCDWVIKGLGMSSRVCDWVIKGLGMSSRVCAAAHIQKVPCNLSTRVEHRVPVIGFFLVSFINYSSSELNKLYIECLMTMFSP